MAGLSTLSDGIALTHVIVADDVERAAHVYSEPTIVALANSWIIINVGGGPTDDKPSVTLEPPRDRRAYARLPGTHGGRPHGLTATEKGE
jgi:hypothetical protein